MALIQATIQPYQQGIHPVKIQDYQPDGWGLSVKIDGDVAVVLL